MSESEEPNKCTCGPSMRPGGYDPLCPIDGEATDEDDGEEGDST